MVEITEEESDKIIDFAASIARQIENFEKENDLVIDVLRWGVGFTDDYVDDGKVIWGDESRRDVTVEYHSAKFEGALETP